MFSEEELAIIEECASTELWYLQRVETGGVKTAVQQAKVAALRARIADLMSKMKTAPELPKEDRP